ncbi:hypothetical protein B7486_41325 [cyanobacterium TDX16]|nr:hypothetical protein B7486_41325 [cyanobacterium TDX16]
MAIIMNRTVMLKKIAPITLTAVGVLLCYPLKANATPNLQIKPISWDIIGLDSNKPDIEGPNVFNIGARVCNLGTSAAKDLQAKINLGSGTGSTYISILGLNTLNINYLPAGGAGSTFHNIGNTGSTPSYCADFYFNVTVQRILAAHDTYREYYIEATGKDLSGTQLATITTPQPRRLYVQQLVEQNRNKVLTFTGTTTVQSGDIVDYTVTGQTAPGGYEQLVFATNFPNTVFQILKVNTNYTTPSGTTNNSIYGDACGWDSDPNSSFYRTCDNPSIPDGYTGGKVGDDFTAKYKVKIISTQSQTIGVSSLVYDKSGNSYHYNTTYKIPPDYDININVNPAVTADLSLTKTVNKLLPNVGENVTFTINVKNDGPDNATNVKVQDIFPAGLTYVSSNASVAFGATTPAYLSVSDYNGGFYTSSTGMWDIGTIPKGATATLQIVATVNTTDAITNIAEVNASNQADPDSTPNNGNVNEDDRAAVTFNQRVSISGTVFEDVNYGGGAGRDYTTANSSATVSGFSAGVIRRPNARVELYNSAGNFLTSTLTDSNGAYTFTNQPGNATYTVRVVNGTVTSARPSSGGTLIPVQTYRSDASTGTVTGVADRVGGENPTLVDAGNGSTTLAALTTATTTAQSIAQINAGASNITGVDFGFNFDTIVSTRDSGQGSLRQFIINSNALQNTSLAQVGVLSGREESIFMISDGVVHPGLRAGLPNQFSGGVATITLATALPAIANATGSTNANRTSIDARTQTALTGDTNAPIFNTTTGPEIVLNVAAGSGLEVQASFSFIKNIGITGANGTSTAGVGVYFNGAGANNSRLENSTIFSNDNSGVKFQSATNVHVNSNIIRNNGVTDPLADGVELIGASSNNVTENIIINNPGYGIDLHTTTNNNNNLSSNQIANNGTPDDTQDAGIGIRLGSNNLIGQNTLANNLGDGIVVASGTGNQITENSIYNNGGLGIDLGGGSEGNGVTLNDNGDSDTGANNLFNFPVLESAQLSGGNLIVKGFARPGSKIEFFVKQPDPSGFGEGQEYLVTLIENSADDTNTTTGTYTSPFNGLNQGTDTTNRFEFSIPLSSLPNAVTTADKLTATATCLSGNCTSGSTSEFSGNITVTGSPHISLVKRITAINGVPFSGFDGVATDPNNNSNLDEDVNWSVPLDDYLGGRLDGGFVQPGEEVEYTIYYLSTGATTAQNVLFCDRVPANMSFVTTAFDSYPVQASGGLQGVARGILWQYNGTTESLTNVSDGDTAMYFPPGVEPSSVYSNVNCQGSNTTGAIVVNLGNLPNATAPGIPPNAYGFVRFRAKLN